VFASDDARREWAGQRLLTPDEADDPATPVAAVVIGDAGDELSWRNLDIAFRRLRAGAAFIAMHRNLWWMTPKGFTLDSGALVAGLEEALGRRATIAGKPSPVVFREALRELAAETRAAGRPRLRAGEVAMVGDDLDSDVAGAHRVGLRALLVLTGKTDRASLAADAAERRLRGPRRPDGVGPSLLVVVDQLLTLLGGDASRG
jgi:HAD superfamily hydrolase (TIGR01450 family)